MVSAYYEKKLTDKDENVRKVLQKNGVIGKEVLSVLPPTDLQEKIVHNRMLSLARLECHYFANHMSWEDDNYILFDMQKIQIFRPILCMEDMMLIADRRGCRLHKRL